MRLTDNKKKLFVFGILAGLVAVLLAATGNPKNMAICIACFVRDIAGSMGLHQAAPVQYFRPEIVGLVLGALLMATAGKEFRVIGGSSRLIRFLLGFMMMLGALVFLGCPTRMVLRMAAGDLTAYIGLIGFAGGVLTGSFFLRRGFSLGRATKQATSTGYILPALLVVGFVLSLVTAWFYASAKGPGSLHAPVYISLIGGLLFGALAQKSRMCFAGAIRDVALLKNFNLLSIIGGLFVSMLIYNVLSGNFAWKIDGNPIAHAQHLWNILGLYVVGFCGVLLGGCPLRQLIMTGQGNTDSAITVIGMLFGTAAAHRLSIAAAAQTAESAGGPGLNGKIAVLVCIGVLFVIAVLKSKKVKYD